MEVRSHSTWKRSKRREKRETIRYESDPHSTAHKHTRSFHFRFACQCHTQQHTSDHINIADVRVVPCVQACVYVCVCSSPVSWNLNISFSNRPFLLLFCILSFGFFLFFRHSEKVAPRKYVNIKTKKRTHINRPVSCTKLRSVRVCLFHLWNIEIRKRSTQN